jgi:phenylalanine-4-hydroxylase
MKMEHLVELDQDHPGFRDPDYRRQRDEVAAAAVSYWTQRKKEPKTAIPEIDYSADQHRVWEYVLARVRPLVETNVISTAAKGFDQLNFPTDRIPSFGEVNRILEPRTGVRIVPVAGLIQSRHFFSSLAKKEFYSTQYIRHGSNPDFTPEPDICHDMLGHLPLLLDPDFCRVSVDLARAALVCREDQILELERLYWFAFEYGLCYEQGVIKTFGSGNISSYADLERCVDGSQVLHLPFKISEIIETDYDPTIQQPKLFLAKSLEAAMQSISEYLHDKYKMDKN